MPNLSLSKTGPALGSITGPHQSQGQTQGPSKARAPDQGSSQAQVRRGTNHGKLKTDITKPDRLQAVVAKLYEQNFQTSSSTRDPGPSSHEVCDNAATQLPFENTGSKFTINQPPGKDFTFSFQEAFRGMQDESFNESLRNFALLVHADSYLEVTTWHSLRYVGNLAPYQKKPADEHHNPSVVATLRSKGVSKPRVKLDNSWNDQIIAVLKKRLFPKFRTRWNTLKDKVKGQGPAATFELSTISFPRGIVATTETELDDMMVKQGHK
ncbi:hypothetical protein MAM1_0136d06294 [Mucor ambiguus]|uniref:Uncharacterized protein n=1 Tax=Mucor ambiguus TaxID=91626 RepID=A0A0C9MHN2_9FUNG|nr:hypothetical protein MAM1_0136d06294 [Mucor ambiguus]